MAAAYGMARVAPGIKQCIKRIKMHHLHAKNQKSNGQGVSFPRPFSTGERDTMLFRLKILWGRFLSPSPGIFSNVGSFRFFAKS